MNTVLILSDSHGLTEDIADITKRHQIKHMIHCGDSELDMDATELTNFIKVAGNCDHDNRLPEEQTIEVGGLTFFIVHGHLHGVKSNLTRLSYRAEEMGAGVICFGHTHVAGAQKFNNQLFINPGSIRLPRSRNEKTYAIMQWETIDDVNVNFYTLAGACVEDLSYKGSLA